MVKKTISLCLLLLTGNCLISQTAGQVKILFDASHAETSGVTADWCIDADATNMNWGSSGGYTCTSCTHSNPQKLPTPSQTLITSSTAETYWTGGISYWATDCVKKGYWVETLPFGGSITYGNSSNPQDLSNYDVFIVDEPNVLFTAAEKIALMNFVQNGGGLFAISDHDQSDRNNDGWDSPAIWNDFFTNNGVANNAFGYTFALRNFSQTSSNVSTSASDSIIHGLYGNVAKVQWSNGTSININPAQNPSVKAHVWRTGISQSSDTAAMCVTAHYGCGKIASIGDSSPTDDGTGNPNSTLYTGYTGDAAGNHRPWLMNITMWLAQPSCGTSTGVKNISQNELVRLYPNPVSERLFISFPPHSGAAEYTLRNELGEVVYYNVTTENEAVINVSRFSPGVYYISLSYNGTSAVKKIVKLQ